MLGEIIGAGIGAAGSYFSSQQSADFSERAYKHRYRWMVKDLQKAGLNPMLAAGTSPGSVAQPDFQNVGEGALKGASAAAAIRQAKAQAENIEENTATTRALGNKAMAEGKRQEMDNLILEASPPYQSAKATLGPRGEVTGASAAQTARWDADLAKTRAEAEKVAADTGLSKLQADLAKGEITLQQVKIKYADELAQVETAYRAAMSAAAAANVPAAQADAEFWRNAGDLGKWASFIKSILK